MTLEQGFKRVRNQLAKCDLDSLITQVAGRLHWAETKTAAEFGAWLPWRLLLLLKWGFEFCNGHYPPRLVDEQLLIKLVNLIHEFEGASPHPFLEEGTVAGLQRFLRTIAFQQFWLQHRLGGWEIARQYSLFCRLPEGHIVSTQFTRLFGLTMTQFLELSIVLWSWLINNPANIVFSPNSLFANLTYSEEEVGNFLRCISRSPAEVRQYLRERKQAINSPLLQLVEQTPFIRYPLLQRSNDYLVYSRRVFEATIGDFFYDVMKANGGSAAAQEFAEVLERYTERGLAYTGVRRYTERELKPLLAGSKVTDFILPFEDCTVLIEVKAVEIRQTVRANPESDKLTKELRDSVVKAAIQGFTVAHLVDTGLSSLDIPCRTEFFLLIVTYRDLQLGPSQAMWDEFLRDAVVPKLDQSILGKNLLRPSRIAVVSIREFDQLIHIMSDKPHKLPSILRKMEVDDATFETAKWNVSQHLDAYHTDQGQAHFLQDDFQQVTGRVARKFRRPLNP